MSVPIGQKYNFSWQQTMYRIKDPKVSVPFYEQHFGMKLIHKYDFPADKFSLYFLERPREGTSLPTPGTPESEQYLWTMGGTCLELTHNYGTENDDSYRVNNGNVEPHRGFGHIAFNCRDVYKSCETLEKNGVKFQKKPDEGRMKGLAFALDPDGYWIEIVKRADDDTWQEEFNLSQTMLRIKDPKLSLPFYSNILGMTLVRELHMSDFSLYFFAHIPKGVEVPDPKSDAAREFGKTLWQPVVELTHNHGTENDPNFSYANGNDETRGGRGYGHIGFLVDDLGGCCGEMEREGVKFRKRPEDGKMREIAFIYDPDGYSIELIQRGCTIKV
eukprot:GDKI01020604.1.p1 GENE.GDKI01020604.1~~GDKI01020604.1.p1  ORF type:complete len:330 (-),score=94.37 GDKI01020604.1:18-1007(-)